MPETATKKINREKTATANRTATRRAMVGLPQTLASLRIALGAVFAWAFLDKTFGLGYATESGNAWIRGGSPTAGFLQFGTSGPFKGIFEAMAGSAFVDWLFMIGLFGIGAAFIFGIGLRVAAASGATLLVLMWVALLPVENNPVLDDHLVYALAMVALAMARSGDTWGFGKAWAKTDWVKRYPILE